jgi:acyl-CoA thioesterase-1
LKQIIERLKRTEAKIIFFGMQIPPNLWVQYARDFAAIYPRLAKKYQLVFFPFFLEWVAAQPQYNLSDGIHPNAQGYAVIVKNISDIIRNPHAYQK